MVKKKCVHFMLRCCGTNEYQCEEDTCLKVFKIKLPTKNAITEDSRSRVTPEHLLYLLTHGICGDPESVG